MSKDHVFFLFPSNSLKLHFGWSQLEKARLRWILIKGTKCIQSSMGKQTKQTDEIMKSLKKFFGHFFLSIRIHSHNK